jgi:hypothetical protein
MATSYQFYGARVLQDAVVAAYLSADSPFGIGIRHGWDRCGDPMTVTASNGNDLLSLDDRPALDVYLKALDAPDGIEEAPGAFAEFALTHPVAISRPGEDAVRHVLSADPVARSLTAGGGMPKGATAWLMTGDIHSTIAATDSACADAISQLGGVPLRALLVFDGAGRRTLLGNDGMVVERRTIAEHAGDAPVGGFYSFGEIARTTGLTGFHNQTIVTLALS